MENYGVCSSFSALTREDGTPLTNFGLHQPVAFYSPDSGRTPAMLRLQIQHLNRKYTVDLDLHNPQLLRQLQAQIPTCKVLKSGAHASVEAYILELQSRTIAAQPPLYFREHGFHRLPDGQFVFVAGDEVLGLPESWGHAIAPEVARAHLAYDKKMSLLEAIQGFWKILERDGDIVLPLWGVTLSSSTRSQLIDVDLTTFPSCGVVGGQNLGKTTVCRRFALLYDDKLARNHHWGEVDAGSTLASTIEHVQRYRDQMVLVDDGAKSGSPTETRKRRALLAEILRFASNDSDRSKMGLSQEIVAHVCTAGLVFTSESPLEYSSDIGRTISIPIMRQMENGNPHDRVYAATVFRYFILWLLPRLDKELSDLCEQLLQVEGQHQRLKRNYNLVMWALLQFFNFIEETTTISPKTIKAMWKHSLQICKSILGQQIEQVDHLENHKSIGWYILDGLQRKVIEPISRKRVEKGKRLPQCYCVQSKADDTVYITTDVLFRFLQEHSPYRFSSINGMDKQLILDGIIHPGQEGKAATTRIDGKRYLSLQRIDLLKAASRLPYA